MIRKHLEQLEDRANQATVDFSGGVLSFTDTGSENNNLTVGVGGGVYSFNDSLTPITLTHAALDAGYKGSGTKSISGPESAVDGIEVYAGGGTNTDGTTTPAEVSAASVQSLRSLLSQIVVAIPE